MPGTNLTQLEAQERAKRITNAKYAIQLDLRNAVSADSQISNKFSVTVTVNFDFSHTGVGTWLDFVGKSVQKVLINGAEINANDAFRDSRIELPGEHLQNGENTVQIEATANFTNTGEGLHKLTDTTDGEVYLYSQFEVADTRRVWPVFEQPDIKGQCSFEVLAPAHWEVISAERETSIETIDDTTRLWHFPLGPILPPYIYSIHAGPYKFWEDSLINSDGREIPLRLFARHTMAQYFDPENIFYHKQGFDFYADTFKVPFPYNKYDQIFTPQFNAGAMENVGAVTYREDYIFRSKVSDALRERRVVTIVHELAHMWFGNLVTMKWWNDLWLNESFAELMATLATAEATEFENYMVTFNCSEKAWGMSQDQLSSTHPIVAEIKDLEDVLVNFDGITYAKGAAVLMVLLNYVGRENFFAGVTEYLKKYSWQNATLSEFLDEIQAVSKQDLKEWSKEWLETSGVNTLTPVIESDADGKITRFEILQEAPIPVGQEPHKITNRLRSHHIGIGLFAFSANESNDSSTSPTATGSFNLKHARLQLVEQLQVDVLPQAITEIPELVGKQRQDLVLLDYNGLDYSKVIPDESSAKVLLKWVQLIADPLARAIGLDILWNLVRDGKLYTSTYAQTALTALASETESTAIQEVLRNLSASVHSYVPFDIRNQLVRNTATALWNLARDAKHGSDAQYQFVKHFASFAVTGEQANILKDLRDNTIRLDGLTIDADLKWEINKGLARSGALDNIAIQQALDEDSSENGQIAVAFCRAAIPTVEAKNAAFNELFSANGTKLSNSIVRATAVGFSQVTNYDLLDEFLPKYFDNINAVWDNNSFAVAESILCDAYPSRLAKQELIDAAEQWLTQNPSRPDALKRIISENRDITIRALTAQSSVIELDL